MTDRIDFPCCGRPLPDDEPVAGVRRMGIPVPGGELARMTSVLPSGTVKVRWVRLVDREPDATPVRDLWPDWIEDLFKEKP